MSYFQPETQFAFDERLGIPLPALEKEWGEFTFAEQAQLLLFWESVRGRIPDRIFTLERSINELQQRVNQEENFETVCLLSWEIAELASAINDLHIYFRLKQDVAAKAHH